MIVIVATPTLAGLEGFTKGLIDSGAEVAHARNGMAALEMAKARSPALVVVDSDLKDFRPFELVTELARVDASINTAVMTHLDDDAFHAKAEGLGVLASLGTQPGAKDAVHVMTILKRVQDRIVV